MAQTGHHPPHPRVLPKHRVMGLKELQVGGMLPSPGTGPTPAPCLTHLQLLEKQVSQDTVAEAGHAVQSAGCGFPGRLALGGSHPRQALCQSPVWIRGAKSQGAPILSSTAQTDMPSQMDYFVSTEVTGPMGSWGESGALGRVWGMTNIRGCLGGWGGGVCVEAPWNVILNI